MARLAALSSRFIHYEEALYDLKLLYIARGYPLPLVSSWLREYRTVRWEKRIAPRVTTSENDTLVVLKTQFNPAWDPFNVHELRDVVVNTWVSHLAKYEVETALARSPLNVKPMPRGERGLVERVDKNLSRTGAPLSTYVQTALDRYGFVPVSDRENPTPQPRAQSLEYEEAGPWLANLVPDSGPTAGPSGQGAMSIDPAESALEGATLPGTPTRLSLEMDVDGDEEYPHVLQRPEAETVVLAGGTVSTDPSLVTPRDEPEDSQRVPTLQQIEAWEGDKWDPRNRWAVFRQEDPQRARLGITTGRVIVGDFGGPIPERVFDVSTVGLTTAPWIVSRKKLRNLGDMFHIWNRSILNPAPLESLDQESGMVVHDVEMEN